MKLKSLEDTQYFSEKIKFGQSCQEAFNWPLLL